MSRLFILIILFFFTLPLASQFYEVDTIQFNGSVSSRINLVILADGYQESELQKFSSDAQKFTNALFLKSPFKEYKNYFNVVAIKSISLQSGAKHPGNATDVVEPASPITQANNLFGSTFDFAKIHRLLVATNTSKLASVLFDNFPLYDMVLILVNTTEYGGSGGFYAVSSTHPSANEIAIHELGHSFGLLSDEYYAGDQYARESPNMTKEKVSNIVKWKNWMGINGVGIHQHCCGGNSSSWYRPHENCLMRFLGREFCSVCSEQIIEVIHNTVKPYDSKSPTIENIDIEDLPSIFKLNKIQTTNKSVKVDWYLNDSLYKSNVDSVELIKSDLVFEKNILKAKIEDKSTLLKVDNHSSHKYEEAWQISRKCFYADVCKDALNSEILKPKTDGNCYSALYCNEGATSEEGDCDLNGASTWIRIEVDSISESVIINLKSSSFTPLISIYQGSCDSQPLVSCSTDRRFSVTPINKVVLVKIEATQGQNLGEFSLEACANSPILSCHKSEVTITRPEFPNAKPDTPYCPDETISLCFEIEFYVSSILCQWIQGIIPTFSGGWDLLESNLELQSPAGFNWFGQDTVDYNFNNDNIHLIDLGNGKKGLRPIGSNPLKSGDLLPAGWWATSNGSGQCLNDGDPDHMWGLPASCNSVKKVNFCIKVKVKSLSELMNCIQEDLDFNVYVFSDNETGCWTANACKFSMPIFKKLDLDCSSLIIFNGDNKEICGGNKVTVEASVNKPAIKLELKTIDNPNVIGETLNGTFENSLAFFTDSLINTGNQVEEVVYTFKAIDNSECNSNNFHNVVVKVFPKTKFIAQITNTTIGQSSGSISLSEITQIGVKEIIWSNAKKGAFIDSLAEGKYTATVLDNNNCTTEIGPYAIFGSTNSINNSLIYVCHIYPNPANTVLNFISKSNRSISGDLALTNAMGQIVYQDNVDLKDGKTEIDVSKFAAGIYFLSIKSEAGDYHKKVEIVK